MRCRVCSHAQRAAIETAVERGGTIPAVAAKFALSESALAKHLDLHPRAPAPKPAKAKPARAKRVGAVRAPSPTPAVLEEDDAPITSKSPRLTSSRDKVLELLDTLNRIGKDFTAETPAADRIAVAKAMVAPIKVLAQLNGELGASEATVVASPHFKRLLGTILEALRDHAPARRAVIDALERARGGATEAAA